MDAGQDPVHHGLRPRRPTPDLTHGNTSINALYTLHTGNRYLCFGLLLHETLIKITELVDFTTIYYCRINQTTSGSVHVS